MEEFLTGKDICSRYHDIENDAFGTESHRFMRTTIEKEKLYDVPCPFSSNGKNLLSYSEWAHHPENYDGFHTNNVEQMIDYIKKGGKLPPLITNRALGLYDGQHRLTAYSMVPEITTVTIYREVENR